MRLEQKSKLATEYARERKEKNIKNCEKEEHICALSRTHRDSYLPCYPATNLPIFSLIPRSLITAVSGLGMRQSTCCGFTYCKKSREYGW